MDQTIVAAIRKDLETKSTAELRQAYEGGDRATWSPEQVEATRQLLDERSRRSIRPVIALGSAILVGAIGAAAAWWQDYPGEIVFAAGVGCAALGAASFYVPGLISQH